MAQQRNFEVALKDYVDRLFSLEQSERDKDYQALVRQLNQIADGVDVNLNVSGEGSGLAFDLETNSLQHSNKLNSSMTAVGQTGVGSPVAIPTIRFDKNGHIIDATNNLMDTEVKQNSMNAVLSGAVYAAIAAEKQRAMAAEQAAQQTALAAGTEYSIDTTLYTSNWDRVLRETTIHNPKITGYSTELIKVDYPEYEAYTCGITAVSTGAGYVKFSCQTLPTKDIKVHIIISATVAA